MKNPFKFLSYFSRKTTPPAVGEIGEVKKIAGPKKETTGPDFLRLGKIFSDHFDNPSAKNLERLEEEFDRQWKKVRNNDDLVSFRYFTPPTRWPLVADEVLRLINDPEKLKLFCEHTQNAINKLSLFKKWERASWDFLKNNNDLVILANGAKYLTEDYQQEITFLISGEMARIKDDKRALALLEKMEGPVDLSEKAQRNLFRIIKNSSDGFMIVCKLSLPAPLCRSGERENQVKKIWDEVIREKILEAKTLEEAEERICQARTGFVLVPEICEHLIWLARPRQTKTAVLRLLEKNEITARNQEQNEINYQVGWKAYQLLAHYHGRDSFWAALALQQWQESLLAKNNLDEKELIKLWGQLPEKNQLNDYLEKAYLRRLARKKINLTGPEPIRKMA